MGEVARVAEAVACDGLTKVYATGAVALDNLTLTIPQGASFGLLGENGAGKSTLVRLLMGFIRARTYLVLARLPARAAYSRGLILAVAALRVFDGLLAVALAAGTERIIHPTLGPILVGLAALTANCIVLATLTVTLCAPIGSRRLLIAFLAWLLAALIPAYDIARLPAILSVPLSLARLPLPPVSTVFAAGAGGTFDWPALAGLAVEAVYVRVLALFAGSLLEKRELLLH